MMQKYTQLHGTYHCPEIFSITNGPLDKLIRFAATAPLCKFFFFLIDYIVLYTDSK